MFTGQGYNEDVDWWSVGITFYECVYGTVSKIIMMKSPFFFCGYSTIYRDHGRTARTLMN